MYKAGQRVLVVDDFEHFSRGLSMLFSTLGHEVRVASSGRAALSVFESFEPTVVTLDIELGDTTGFEVARAIRDCAREQPYIVAVTGRSEEECRPHLTSAGFNGFVNKPIELEDVEAILHAASVRVAV